MEISFLIIIIIIMMWRSRLWILSKPFMLKGLTNPNVGVDGEDPTKGTHKTTMNALDVFN